MSTSTHTVAATGQAVTGFFDKPNTHGLSARINVAETPLVDGTVRIDIYAPATLPGMTPHGATPPVYPANYEHAALATLPIEAHGVQLKPGDPLNPFPVDPATLQTSADLLQHLQQRLDVEDASVMLKPLVPVDAKNESMSLMTDTPAFAARTGNVKLTFVTAASDRNAVMEIATSYFQERGYEEYVAHRTTGFKTLGNDASRTGGSAHLPANAVDTQPGSYYHYNDATGVQTSTWKPFNGGGGNTRD